MKEYKQRLSIKNASKLSWKDRENMEYKNTHQEVQTKSKIPNEKDTFYTRNILFVDVAITKYGQITPEHHG